MSYKEQIMSKDKYPSIFSPQMATIVFIILRIFFALPKCCTLSWWGGLRALVTLEAISAGTACSLLRNRFAVLEEAENDDHDINSKWAQFSKAYNNTAENVLGRKRKSS